MEDSIPGIAIWIEGDLMQRGDTGVNLVFVQFDTLPAVVTIFEMMWY